MQFNIKKLADYQKIASESKRREVSITPEEIERLRMEKERMEKERLRSELLEKISDSSELDIPEDWVEKERGLMLESVKQQVAQILQISFEDYLKKINKTEKELSDSLLSDARKRVKNFLVLGAIAEKENVAVSDEELKAEAGKILSSYPNTGNVDPEQLREYTKNAVRNEKTLKILESFAK